MKIGRGFFVFAPALALAPTLAFLVACGGAEGASSGGTTPGAGGFNPAATNASKCGACHAPFDPGGHTKSDLQRVLKVHKDENRVKLTDDQWDQMIDYLAKK